MNRGEVAALKQGDVILDDRGRECTVLYVEESGRLPPDVLVKYGGHHYLLTWRQCKQFVRPGA
jgi:hypothetical protein